LLGSSPVGALKAKQPAQEVDLEAEARREEEEEERRSAEERRQLEELEERKRAREAEEERRRREMQEQEARELAEQAAETQRMEEERAAQEERERAAAAERAKADAAKEKAEVAAAQKAMQDFLRARGFKNLTTPRKAFCGATMYPLHVAVEEGNADAVRALLRCGADKAQRNSAKMTPYQLAEKCNKRGSHEAIVNMLKA